MKCPKCQFSNPEGHKFCGSCGYKLQEPEQTPPIDAIKTHTPKATPDTIAAAKGTTEGERKRLTMLFADLSGYTAMNERIDPEEVKGIMRRIFGEIGQVVTKYDGFVDRFFGDEVMIVFGIPRAHEDDPVRAVRAAMEIHDLVKNISPEFEHRIGQPLRMHIGINTGLVVTGDEYIGKGRHGLTGDAINLAARLTKLAQAGETMVGPDTFRVAEGYFTFETLKPVRVKGKKEPVTVFQVIAPSNRRATKAGVRSGRRVHSKMVGRDKDLSKLELQVMKAINGEGSVVNVIGEAGIGKSRLVSELRNSPMMRQVTLLEGRAISIGRNFSFHPIIDLLKHWAQITEDDSEAVSLSKLETAIRNICRQDANEIFPFVATLMGMKLSGSYAKRVKGIEGTALEKLILKNIKDLIITSTELVPLVIIIEDLHWADISSIELLESLFRLTDAHNILFINVFRPNHPETGDRIIESLKQETSIYCVEIILEALNEKMSEALIDNMLNIKGLHYEMKNRIIQQTGGNPFFIEEVVRSFIDEGAVVIAEGKFEVTDKMNTMVIPTTINDVLMARIDRLEEKTRSLVKVASVIGRNFFHKVLTEVSKEVENIDSRLSYLKEIQLIRERRRMEELEYLFKHALAQEAAYESILHQKRKEIHLQVARSIEKVFKERLHEFYGMLALHYMKGEDNENAEHYLIKAGEEALRASASSEALNYYQEGLKLYLQATQDTADPEKLAMFEKNIAIALFNKCRWVECVQHIDNVFKYWNIKASPNRFLSIIKYTKNIIFITTVLDRISKGAKKIPGQRDNEIFRLLIVRSSALIYYDNIGLFLNQLNAFNKIRLIDWSKSFEAIRIFIGNSITFSATGLSFKLPYKLLDLFKSKMDQEIIANSMAFTYAYDNLNSSSGNWEKISPFKETIVNDALKKGDLWSVAVYLVYITYVSTEKGDFDNTQRLIDKLSEIAVAYDYHLAAIYADIHKTYLVLKKGLLPEAIKKADEAISFAGRIGMEIQVQIYLCRKAQAQILLNDVTGARDSLLNAKKIIDQHKYLMPVLNTQYLIAQFMTDIALLKEAIVSKDRKNLSKLKKDARLSEKRALNNSKKFAVHSVEALRLMGNYHWLIGRQRKAFKWWERAITKGEKLDARPDLSRTYFEIAKHLLEPDSKQKKLNGITADEYLQKAKTMFEEMDLQWDLNELHKLMAHKTGKEVQDDYN